MNKRATTAINAQIKKGFTLTKYRYPRPGINKLAPKQTEYFLFLNLGCDSSTTKLITGTSTDWHCLCEYYVKEMIHSKYNKYTPFRILVNERIVSGALVEIV
ncbi:MAG: hypothetical protein ISR65_07480 [Bacteriovoracaceae bacterium]|nr:hypothetical protein [Bacteriovoracaceae bacterium]